MTSRKDNLPFICTKVDSLRLSPVDKSVYQSHSGRFVIFTMDPVQVVEHGGGNTIFTFLTSILTAFIVVNYNDRSILILSVICMIIHSG